MEVCCHEADNKTGWFCKVNRNVISWTCRRGAHFGVRNICLRGSWMISKCLTSSRLLLPEVTTCVLRCVAEWEWSDFRHCGRNGKRFFLWGAVDFSHHLYVQMGSRICPESCPGILHLRIKHVNHEAALCYAEILDVLQCTSRRHCVVLTRRTSVGLPLLSNKSLILLSCTTDSLGWLRGKSEMIICWWAASCSRKYSSLFFKVICSVCRTIPLSCCGFFYIRSKVCWHVDIKWRNCKSEPNDFFLHGAVFDIRCRSFESIDIQWRHIIWNYMPRLFTTFESFLSFQVARNVDINLLKSSGFFPYNHV